jgi:hypothetical protein
MRSRVVVLVLLGMMIALGAMLALRTREPHAAPTVPAASATPGADAGAPAAAASAMGTGAAAPAPGSDAGAPLVDRPLVIAGLGWDTLVAGVLANRGTDARDDSDFARAGVPVRLVSFEQMATLEGALARGGADKDGADVAIVPLPTFVASYERLRALSPEIFFVVGWSRGREALVAARADALVAAPAAGAKLAAAPGEPAAFFGLLALDLAGGPPPKLLGPGSRDATLEAIDRGTGRAAEGRTEVVLTTADASRLIPFVAVAQRGLIEQRGPALTAWARTWLAAQRQLDGDPPAAARQVASAAGGIEPLALLKRLGERSPAPLGDVTRVAGLSGRGAVTLEALFRHSWRIWKASGVLATPPPEASPVNNSVITAVVRAEPSFAAPPAAVAGKGDRSAVHDKARVLLVARQPDGKLDEAAFVDALGLVAGVFERAPLRVTVRGGGGVDAARTKKLIEAAEGRFDIAPGRMVPGTKAIDRAAAAIEVLE